jgi:hypothetical protein
MNVNRGVRASFFKVALIAVVMSLFAVSCGGGDDDVQVESRVKNAAPRADSGEDRPWGGYCLENVDRLDSFDALYEGNQRSSLTRMSGLGYSRVVEVMSGLKFSDDSGFSQVRYLLNRVRELEDLEGIMMISLDRLRDRLDLDNLSDSKRLLKDLEQLDFLDFFDNRNIRDLREFYNGINRNRVSVLRDLIDDSLLDNENNRLNDLMRGLDDSEFAMVLTNLNLIAHSDLLNLRDLLNLCDDESDSGTDLVTTTTVLPAPTTVPPAPTTLPAIDDAVSDDSTESASVCFDPAVEQFREDLALFRVAQSGRNDQSLTEEQRQGHRDDYASAYDVKTKSAAAAIEVANERGFNLDSPDNLDESFLSRWDSTICE